MEFDRKMFGRCTEVWAVVGLTLCVLPLVVAEVRQRGAERAGWTQSQSSPASIRQETAPLHPQEHSPCHKAPLPGHLRTVCQWHTCLLWAFLLRVLVTGWVVSVLDLDRPSYCSNFDRTVGKKKGLFSKVCNRKLWVWWWVIVIVSCLCFLPAHLSSSKSSQAFMSSLPTDQHWVRTKKSELPPLKC